MSIVALVEFARESTNESQLLVAVVESRMPHQAAVAKDPQFTGRFHARRRLGHVMS